MSTKLSWPQLLLRLLIGFFGVLLAAFSVILFFLIKNSVNFSSILIFTAVFLASFFIFILVIKILVKIIRTRLDEFDVEIDNFLKFNSLSRENIYMPPVHNFGINISIFQMFFFSIYIAVILTGMFFVFYYLT